MTLTSDLLQIRDAALAAVDPGKAVRCALRLDGDSLHVSQSAFPLDPQGRLLLIAIGKAAPAMAQAAAEILGDRLASGIVVTKDGHARGCTLPPSLRVFESGHPVPDARGLQAAHAIDELLDGLTPRDHLLVLVSGGASALLPYPAQGVSLDDLQALTGLLLRSGAGIHELNAVRKHLDRFKGGQLARRASPARVTALVLSDVVGDRLDVIASGPTAPDPTTFQDAWNILYKYNVIELASPAILEALRDGLAAHRRETVKPGDPLFSGVHKRVHNQIVASNRQAAQAAVQAAGQLGYHALLLTTFMEGEARTAGQFAAALVRGELRHSDPLPRPACIVIGGETTVTVRGEGRGGRNQELALSAALALEGISGWALMALATDGADGPTDSAGAVVDGETTARGRAAGLDAQDALVRNDSYPFLKAAEAQMHTGPTGTNVNDLLVILVE